MNRVALIGSDVGGGFGLDRHLHVIDNKIDFDAAGEAPISVIDTFMVRRYKVFMKTLTITDAKKNLGRWLAAAARGDDIGIICGADIVALRKVDVESTDYAQREYGAAPERVAALEKATEERYRRLKRSKKLTSATAQELGKLLE